MSNIGEYPSDPAGSDGATAAIRFVWALVQRQSPGSTVGGNAGVVLNDEHPVRFYGRVVLRQPGWNAEGTDHHTVAMWVGSLVAQRHQPRWNYRLTTAGDVSVEVHDRMGQPYYVTAPALDTTETRLKVDVPAASEDGIQRAEAHLMIPGFDPSQPDCYTLCAEWADDVIIAAALYRDLPDEQGEGYSYWNDQRQRRQAATGVVAQAERLAHFQQTHQIVEPGSEEERHVLFILGEMAATVTQP